MLRFDLASAAKSRRKEVVLPPIADSVGAVTEAQRAIRAMLREMASEVRADLLPAYEADLARLQSELTGDAGEFSDLFIARLKELAARLGRIAAETVNRILRREANRHTDKWKAQVRSALGIDLEAVIRQEDLTEALDAASKRSASLITGLSDETAAGVEKLTRRALAQGMASKDLRKELTAQFGIADRRAKVIARDQLATLNSDLNRIRHTQAGVTDYIWSSSQDSRVRKLHQALNGRRYKYGEPTGAEGGLGPGQPIMCFVGSDRIFADHGVNRLFRYWHSGNTTSVVTESGEAFEATPNHPVLTRRGWQRVEELKVGDDLVHARFPGLFGGEVDVKEWQPRFDDLFELVAAFGTHSRREGFAGNLYGDAPVDQEIEVVTAESGLRFNVEASDARRIGEFILKEAFMGFPSLSDQGDADLRLRAALASPAGIVRGLSELELFIAAQSSHADEIRSAAIAEFYAKTVKVIGNCLPLAAEAFAEREDAFAGHVQPSYLFAVKVLRVLRWTINGLQDIAASSAERFTEGVVVAAEFGGDVLNHLPGVELGYRTIKEVVGKSGGQLVYTSETNLGWYSTNNLVARNCRCVARAVVEFDGQDFSGRGRRGIRPASP